VLALTLLTDKPSITIKTLAQNVLTSLEAYINGGVSSSVSSAGTPAARRTPMHSRPGSRGNTRPTTPSQGRDNNAQASLLAPTAQPRYLNHVMFSITNSNGSILDKLALADVEKAMVGIKGIISVTYAAAVGKEKQPAFTLYTSHRPVALQPLVTKAIGDLRSGFIVALLNKDGTSAAAGGADKENQENEVPKSQPPASTGPSYLKTGPSYLKPGAVKAGPSEATSSSKPGYLTNATGSANTTGSRALTTHTTATSASDSAQGLAARYSQNAAAAKKKAAAEPAKKGILSSVTSYFW
jgi:hypothetical protein